MEQIPKDRAEVFKALSDEKRLAVLELLRGGEKCACVLMEDLGMAQSAVSYHMKILCEAGLVTPRQEGKWTHYRLCPTGVHGAVRALEALSVPAEEGGGACKC